MEDTYGNAQKDGNVNNDSPFQRESMGLSNSAANRLTRRINPLHALYFNLMQYRISSFASSDERIPKRLVTIDEKYIQQCLESIHLSASKPSPYNISVKLSSVKMSICDVDRPMDECPLTSGSERVFIGSAGKGIIGSIMGTESLMKIMKSPLFHQFGALENISNSEESPFSTSKTSSQYPENRASTWGDDKYESDSTYERLGSTKSTFDQSSPQSSMDSATLYRGMIQCKWKERIPYFVFSSNDLKEIYEAHLWKVESADDKGADYIYLFRSGKNSQKDDESWIEESHLAGKMTVSTSSFICPDNSKIMETEFVLYGGIGGKSEMEVNYSSNNLGKKKGLSRKVVDVFRTNHLSKQRCVSSFSGQVSGKDYCLWEPPRKNLDPAERFHLLDNNLPSNFQLAAIVVRDHLRENHNDDNVGGWGLKFLKKVEVKQTSYPPENSVPSECCARNAGECSTSTNILIPASLHGGPRTRNGGPSTLTERWRSGGRCDCGGWDSGCPLTKFKVRSGEEEQAPQADTRGMCRSADICIQGSEHVPPILRMLNIRDDVYFIHFQPSLSTLQCFSIAVAIIHSRSPTLKPKIHFLGL